MGVISRYFETVWVRINLSLPVVCIICGIPISIVLLVVTLLSPLWPITVLYLLWMYILDRNTSTTGGRRNLPLRKYFGLAQHIKHMPLIYERVPEAVLDPRKNYLFCCFPHSHTPYGIGAALTSTNTDFTQLFPNHTQRIATYSSFFKIPFYREYLLEQGVICGSEKSLNHILGDPNGGNIIGLAVGGSREVEYATLKDYHIYLKNRKGFVRVALKNGTTLVPVFSFGAENAYNRITIPIFTNFQTWIKEKTGILIYFYSGQGFFQPWFGLAPKFCSIWTIVGKPIEVKKTPNPTVTDIEELHQKFIASITGLFNEYKHKCVKDPDNTKLVIH